MTSSRQADRVLGSILLDLICLELGLALANFLREVLPLGPEVPGQAQVHTWLYLVVPLTWVCILTWMRVYTLGNPPLFLGLRRTLVGHGLSLLVFTGLIYLSNREFSRYILIYFALLSTASVLGWRMLVFLRQRSVLPELGQTLIVGDGSEAERVAAEYVRSQKGTSILGHVATKAPTEPRPSALGDWLGSIWDLPRVLVANPVDRVVVNCADFSKEQLEVIWQNLQSAPTRVYFFLDLPQLADAYASWHTPGDMRLVNVQVPRLADHQIVIKRLFDLILSSVLFVLALPLLAVITLAIKLDSPGPVLLRQKRVGENGRPFWIQKFRTMVANAEQLQASVNQHLPNGKMVHKHPGDPRVTRVGRFLRRWSLDELPQLVNVLGGEMSMVGPRPELPWLIPQYRREDAQRFTVAPGLTGWWQITGRSNKPMHLSVQDDLYYVQNYSLKLDLEILVKTPLAILRGRGAF